MNGLEFPAEDRQLVGEICFVIEPKLQCHFQHKPKRCYHVEVML